MFVFVCICYLCIYVHQGHGRGVTFFLVFLLLQPIRGSLTLVIARVIGHLKLLCCINMTYTSGVEHLKPMVRAKAQILSSTCQRCTESLVRVVDTRW